MSHTNSRRYSGYENSKKKAFDELMDNPALGYKADKYKTLLSDLQAGILKHPKREFVKYLFLSFTSTNHYLEARQWIQDFAPKLTTAMDQLNQNSKSFKDQKIEKEKDPIFVFSLTNSGYDHLRLPEGIKPEDQAFKEDLNSRVNFNKGNTKEYFQNHLPIHAILMIAHDEEITENFITVQLKAKEGLFNYFEQSGSNQVEAFGNSKFTDGIANPKFFPTAYSSSPSINSLNLSDLPPLKLALIVDRGGNTDAPTGSLGAFARFEFNKENIRSLIKQIKDETEVTTNDLPEALIFGRFKDGTPLTLSNKKTNSSTNDFNFSEMIHSSHDNADLNDLDAKRCPFHTHIRKSNPRTPGSETKKIVRRGVYYSENQQTQGLLFVAYQNSLINQFEYMVNHWIMNPLIETEGEYRETNFKDDYTKKEETPVKKVFKHSGVDMIFAKKDTHYSVPKKWNSKNPEMIDIEIKGELIDFEGGVYFFTPSLSFLKKITVFPEFLNPKQEGLTETVFDPVKGTPHNKKNFKFGSIMDFIPKKEETKESKEELKNLYLKYGTRIRKKEKA